MIKTSQKRSPNYTTWSSGSWIYGFLVLQFTCQAALMAPLGSIRIAFRILTFGSSIAMLVLLTARGKHHPLRGVAYLVMGIMVVELLHPQLNSPLAGLGAIAMYFAVWGPIFWVGRIRLTTEILDRAILLLWGFHTLSAIFGVLQVYDPEHFAPDPIFVENLLGEFAEGLKVTLDDGRRIYRPFGLTDSPGGAANSGAFAATVGLTLTVSRRPSWLRLGGALSTAIGMFCLYICQIRSLLIVTIIGFAFMVAVTWWRGQAGKTAWLIATIAAAVCLGFIWAIAVGGQAVTTRLETLAKDDAGAVYYSNRGIFLESTVYEDIPAYPLGAGLGRWGPVNGYFGDPDNLNSPPLWVEIQPTGWVLDGGLLLLFAGYSAVIAACVLSVRMALQATSERFSDNAVAIAAMNFGALAVTFNYPIFISQGGIMFWFLNTLLYTALARTKFPSTHSSHKAKTPQKTSSLSEVGNTP